MYRRLEESQILHTLGVLSQRIEERFPGSGLGKVCRELQTTAREAMDNFEWLRRPIWPVRIGVTLFIGTLLVLLGALLVAAFRSPVAAALNQVPADNPGGLSEFLQGVEALVNDMVFIGIAIWFALTLESRLKRRRALRAIHELRSIAHIVDMHQLTKDPEHLLSAPANTASSPTRNMTRDQLGRYLDYCSEMLSIASKLAALYVQNFADPVVLDAVAEVETLATGLSGKIWQKISLMPPLRAEQPAAVQDSA